ncbi:unnamed protein product (macronuclear) [Paramecium tetraurelia]|uniref:Uncharacterized protein n=1 Tax=Paramecium tetraurelia TaxID=5888 RepID=A0E5V2_PARTE|nr:uncharacterized protein GSPATT00003531001 [Paramecium tetraurelia]CAK90669.1 unnamed protein product [Paramecium tetraurelia]|eukprot:XP_001458066.1 hypothetical protein (macronuclear) [Paramecium tetraurelia strain d4-2]
MLQDYINRFLITFEQYNLELAIIRQSEPFICLIQVISDRIKQNRQRMILKVGAQMLILRLFRTIINPTFLKHSNNLKMNYSYCDYYFKVQICSASNK